MQIIYNLVTSIQQKITDLYDTPEIALANAWVVVEFVTEKKQVQLLAQKTINLTAHQEERLQNILYELINNHKPIQYIIGFIPFLNLTIKVEPPILIPRPETEEWVANLIDFLKFNYMAPKRILDLCTGTGCIALALAQAFPQSIIIASDINRQALELAQKNAHVNGINNCTFIYSDLFEAFSNQEHFDIIVSNPPYLSSAEWHSVQPEIALWEDKRALVAADHGYKVIHKIMRKAKSFLNPTQTSLLIIEIGDTQGPRVMQNAQALGYSTISIKKDLSLKDRVLICSR